MKTRVIASMLVKREDTYLFIKQNKPGGAYPDTLHIPGGGIDDGEAPDVAATREVQEETGLVPTNVRPVDFDWDVVEYKGSPTLLIFLRFLGESAEGEPVPSSDAKEAFWVQASELKNQPHNPPSERLLSRLGLL